MFIRSTTVQVVLVTLTLFAACMVFNYYSYENQRVSTTATANSGRTSSKKATVMSRDGAFYKEADIATIDKDWATKVCQLRELSNLDEFYEYIYTARVPCDSQIMLGGRHLGGGIDGDKWLCLDKRFKLSLSKCLVFSFGIGGDWSFEDEAESKLGCKVYAFDPTINKKSHNRTANIHFFNLGISDTNNTGPGVKTKTDRYINILTGLHHLDSVIDVLKIDVEGNELRFFKDVMENSPNLLKKIKMLSMEVHIGPSLTEISGSHKTFWKYFQLLDCFGFKIYRSAINPFAGGRVINGRHRSGCYEIVWAQDRQW